MKLLLITQKLDVADSTLGFMPRWIEVLAAHCSQLVVICLFSGQYRVPANVTVRSLGKERGRSRVKYLWHLAKYLWQERHHYDTVLVHMNQEYVVLAGWWWWLTGKKVWLWRNHAQGNWLTGLAVRWSQRVFGVSSQAYVARFAKTELMPAGIDTELFAPDPREVRQPQLIRYVGRVAKVKRVTLLIEAAKVLATRGINFRLEIVGAISPLDMEKLPTLPYIKYLPAVRYVNLPAVYRTAAVVVNLTPAGSFDKVILEAMACGTPVVVANPDLATVVPENFLYQGNNPEELANRLTDVLSLSSSQVAELATTLRQYVLEHHSLRQLAEKLTQNR